MQNAEKIWFVNVFADALKPTALPLEKRATCDRGHAQLAREACRNLRVAHRASIASKRL
jgi:hypothetical protein